MGSGVVLDQPPVLLGFYGAVLAPQSGHVSSFRSMKRGPLEPIQLLSGQRHMRKTGARIQTGCPHWIHLEHLERIATVWAFPGR